MLKMVVILSVREEPATHPIHDYDSSSLTLRMTRLSRVAQSFFNLKLLP